MTNDILRLPLPRLAENSFSAGNRVLSVLTDEALFAACKTRIAFTGREGGASAAPFDTLNLSYSVGDAPGVVDANRSQLLRAFGDLVHTDCLISPIQVHGCRIIEVDDHSDGARIAAEEADGILCTLSSIPVLLCFADCVPVILVARDGSFAVAHSGWRGSLDGIAGRALERLVQASGCEAGDVNCYIGPHIGRCCYEVSDELVARFVAEFGEACDAGSRHLDLSAAVIASLVRAGARADRIVDANVCTSCHHDAYYSYRADDGVTGRHGAFAMRGDMS